MRKTALTFLGVIGLGGTVLADDFGPRFAETTPPGLAEYTVEETADIAMDEAAKDLQDIMPAAGEEQITPQGNANKNDKEENQAQ